MVRTAIVEDNDQDAKKLGNYLDKYCLEKDIPLNVTRFVNGIIFLQQFKPGAFDIIFLDIEMPGENGMETAKKIRKIDDKVILIFVTNLAQYAIMGYEVDALDFILKTSMDYQLSLKLDRAMVRVKTNTSSNFFTIAVDNKSMYLLTSSIKYIETSGRKVVFHTTDGDYETYASIKKIISELDKMEGSTFVRCNSYLIINLNYVTSLEGNNVVLGDKRLDVSRPRRKELIDKLNTFMTRGAI